MLQNARLLVLDGGRGTNNWLRVSNYDKHTN